MAKIYHGMTRSQIMQRAWQLAKLNKRSMNDSGRKQLGRWISLAWQEAREGNTNNWTFLSAAHEARSIERQLVQHEMEPSRNSAGIVAALRASLAQLGMGA